MQERRNSSGLAMELCLSWANPSMYGFDLVCMEYYLAYSSLAIFTMTQAVGWELLEAII